MNVIVWDIETVPDLRGFAAANGLDGRSDEDIRTELGDKFPKLVFHSIVCIGALVAHRDGDHWIVDVVGAPHRGERSEQQLISSFVDRIAELTSQLVTFNGNSFDLPVLRYRASAASVADQTCNSTSRCAPFARLTASACCGSRFESSPLLPACHSQDAQAVLKDRLASLMNRGFR